MSVQFQLAILCISALFLKVQN